MGSAFVCAGCGARVAAEEMVRVGFRCPGAGAGDDVDHVLRRELTEAGGFEGPPEPQRPLAGRGFFPEGRKLAPRRSAAAENPFVRYRRLLSPFHAARSRGESDEAFVARVARLDAAIAAVDGRGFRVTPFAPADRLADALGLASGRLWVKDETGNVSGSHKARHLMGVLLALEEEVPAGAPPLAIASCGNAALAAAVLARAGGRGLDVFVPPWAHPRVVTRLRELGARITVCPRTEGETGDPCYQRFREAVAAGAVPFCCQGPDNGLAIEGAATIAWEMLDTPQVPAIDRVFVQVGGGALASALALGFRDAVRLGRIARPPRLHAVQTEGGHPLARAYDRVLARLLDEVGDAPPGAEARADFVLDTVTPARRRVALRHAATHRSEFMWPWESEPKSLATGILDDETYDWLAVVEAMLETGGYPIVVDEATIAAANGLGRESTGVDVDETGTAGLAGLMRSLAGGLRPQGETIAVLFTGARRGAG